MAKTNVVFNNKNYNIDESSLSASMDALKSHLSTAMGGTGATITLGGVSYSVDSAKMSVATSDLVSHFGTIAGDGYKVVVGGVTEVGGDTLTWGTNYDGMLTIDPLGVPFYQVSEAVPTLDDFVNGVTYLEEDGSTVEVPYSTVQDAYAGMGIAAFNDITIIPEDNYVLDMSAMDGPTMTFPKAGVWYMPSGGPIIVSLTIPGYTGFKTTTTAPVEYSLDATKLAGAVAELETVLGGLNSGETGGCDTLYWDGNTEGLVSIYYGVTAYHVSDIVLTSDDFTNGCKLTVSSGDVLEIQQKDIENTDGCFILEAAIVVPYDGFSIDGVVYPKAGIYLIKNEGIHIASLTIPGYTGFEHSEHCGH